jgi:cysteinyl-tRNA synthetase
MISSLAKFFKVGDLATILNRLFELVNSLLVLLRKNTYFCSPIEMIAMEHRLSIYNTLTRKKEVFEPLYAPRVGLYVCGPTVYGDPHLGHARPAITFDILFRYLTHLGYKVRYVRNITDVGHLVNDADSGEDKIAKKARLEDLEPMEVVQFYLNRYHKAMDALNVLPPSIEPHASGHIIEQIQLVKDILDQGYAYESEGSVYFDVEKYNTRHDYGVLSGRNVDDMLNATRELDGQEEKRNSADFALWKKAALEHIMRWPSPWSDGFPGWHLECTAMSKKYLGERFDIHGGGMDLIFPHHECEIAQSVASTGHEAVRYWMHNNMITVNGQKMGKSLGNFINLEEFFTGNHPMLTQAYSPMTVRFFILQAHYRSTVDFSNEALQASEKGLARLMDAYKNIERLEAKATESTMNIKDLIQKSDEAMNDDLNTPIVISWLFEAARIINSTLAGQILLSAEDIQDLKHFFDLYLLDLLGMKGESKDRNASYDSFSKAVDMLLQIRMKAKQNKDWATSDQIRNELTALGFEIKDTKDGFEWRLNN